MSDPSPPRHPPPSSAAPRAGTVALIGRPNVGKSTLMNALLGERLSIVSAKPQTTRDQIVGIRTEGHTQLVFLDTPGLHEARTKLGARMNAAAEEAAASADVVVALVELGSKPAARLAEADEALVRRLPPRRTVLVLNKVDRVKAKAGLLPLLEAIGGLGELAAVIPLSARTGDGAERLLAALCELVPKRDHIYPPDELSDRPVRFFVAEYVREQILLRTRDEVPHGVAVEVESFEEGLRVPRIQVVVHVDKPSHKGIVLGAGGQLMKEIGQGARARVEGLLGRQVHLAVHVRATPGWYESDARLNELGYGGAARRKEPTR